MKYGPLGGQFDTFSYDSRNRLVSAGNESYVYDALNDRVATTQNGVTSRYVVNPNAQLSQVLMETDSSGNPITYYVYGLGLVDSIDSSGNYSIYHFDSRGSTVALTNLSGTVTDTFSYSPYGTLVSHTGTSTTPFEFNGQYGVMTDSNGLYYMRARYFDPTTYTFTSMDTYQGSVTNPLSLDLYEYVENNPLTQSDPNGHAAEQDPLLGGGPANDIGPTSVDIGPGESPTEGTGEEQWYKSDGSINYPPNDGAVPGTEKPMSLEPGSTLGRYGTTSPKSDYVTQPGASPKQLSLPPTTDSSIYTEYRVVKPIPNTIESKVAAWGGDPGGGIQYKLPMPIQTLIREGYIVPIKK